VLIQIILVAGLVIGGGLLLVARPVNARHLALRRLGLLAFVAFGVLAIVAPSITSWVAHRVGVGRGADLLLYLMFAAFLAFVATTGRRHRELERQLTVLTRRIALDEVRPPSGSDAQSSHRP